MVKTVREIISADHKLQSRLDIILETHHCSKQYKCFDQTLEEVCPVCNFGTTELLECSDPNNKSCKFRYDFGEKSFCECAVRILIREITENPA